MRERAREEEEEEEEERRWRRRWRIYLELLLINFSVGLCLWGREGERESEPRKFNTKNQYAAHSLAESSGLRGSESERENRKKDRMRQRQMRLRKRMISVSSLQSPSFTSEICTERYKNTNTKHKAL